MGGHNDENIIPDTNADTDRASITSAELSERLKSDKKYYTLLNLQAINDNDKKKSSADLDISTSVINGNLRSINNSNESVLPACSPLDQARVEVQKREAARTMRRINSEIYSLSTTDPTTELRELDLDRQKLESKVDFTTFFCNIIARLTGNMGINYNRRVNVINPLMDRHENLTSEHKKNVEIGISIDKALDKCEEQASLVDDFANPNTEMPSYMDPED